MIKIIPQEYKWSGTLETRQQTKYIVLHHRAGDGDAQSIHSAHLGRGFSGIGYHFYVRKNGGIYKGRPIGTVGAHAIGVNKESIGICFEGNFEKERSMPEIQKRSGKALLSYLRGLYPSVSVITHREVQSTACPGKYFPFDEIKKEAREMTVDEAVEIVQAKAGLENETIDFLLCYKYGEELLVKIAEAMV